MTSVYGFSVRNFRSILLGILACGSGPITDAATLAIEAESGILGSDYSVTNDGTAQHIAIQTDYLDLESPGSSNRVATYNVVFPAAGTYNLYLRVRVGPQADKDDSFFYGNGFGIKSPTNAAQWIRVNSVLQGGFTNPGDLVTGSGVAGIGVWKWLNVSQFANSSTEPGIQFTVVTGALAQTFQLGARENGLDVDQIIFATSAKLYTVAQLDAIAAGNPPPEGTSGPRDLVNGNLVQFNDNGAWCWYQDERAVIDTVLSKLIVGSVANASGVDGGTRNANIEAVIFDLPSGTSTRCVLLDSSGGHGFSGDDHNAPGLLVRPDGKYLAIYAGHNNDYNSYWTIYDPVSGTWSAEQTFDWTTQPDGSDFPTTYSNPHYLSAEGRTYNISRGNAHGGQNLMVSTDLGDTWSFGGLLTSNANVGYVNGYFRYMDNGRDRIDFICTEYHPRDFNNSIYHGYISNGMTFRTDGTLVDSNIFDKVPATPTNFTPIFLANTVMPAGCTNYRCWNDDVQPYSDGTIAAIISSRVNNNVNGNDAGIDPDHAFFYCRYDGTRWTSNYLCRAGAKLWSNEADYVGLGCLNPSDPNTIYVSTTYDPRNNTNFLGVHEIFKGVTTNHGASFDWTPITRNSTRDNLRPHVPVWDRNNTALLWWRGSYASQNAFDAAVVGLLDRHSESAAQMNYVDAGTGNSFFADTDAPLTTGDGAGQWHLRSGSGNNGGVLASADVNAEDAPAIYTSVVIPDPGLYDVWVNFWGLPGSDWRIMAGLSPQTMQLFRQVACRSVEPGDHRTTLVLTNADGSLLYQAYVGRVSAGTVKVFVNDYAVLTGSQGQPAGNVARTCYDGVSYARVSPLQFNGITSNAAIPAVTLTWSSIAPDSALATLTYTVQKRTSLTSGLWTTLVTGLPSTGKTTSYTDSAAPGSAAFYRVITP